MPFYEYECQSCKFYTEVMQKISDPPLAKCPSCGKRTMQKLVSAPVFRLKGSGWYETDFKSDKEEKRNLAVEREESKPAAEESKPEAKAPAAAESTAKASETKAPGAPPRVTTTSTRASKPNAAAARARPAAAAKPSARSSGSRAKAKPAARPKAAKRGSRR
ncbi:MAG TPA: zinc ribbon domain-containing protein [Steroidobacteraceae bacterium]|nr:zinc ribbon domain-containing protein [Steroidobacteraceae bacterium]